MFQFVSSLHHRSQARDLWRTRQWANWPVNEKVDCCFHHLHFSLLPKIDKTLMTSCYLTISWMIYKLFAKPLLWNPCGWFHIIFTCQIYFLIIRTLTFLIRLWLFHKAGPTPWSLVPFKNLFHSVPLFLKFLPNLFSPFWSLKWFMFTCSLRYGILSLLDPVPQFKLAHFPCSPKPLGSP